LGVGVWGFGFWVLGIGPNPHLNTLIYYILYNEII